MNRILQAAKTLLITPPGPPVDNAAFTTGTIDTLGFRKARVVIALGATDIAIAAMKLRHSDASNMADAADVEGSDFSIMPTTLPSATDDNKIFAIHVNLIGKRRYIDLSLTAGDGAVGTYAAAWVDLYDAEESPNSATERGFAVELYC